MRERVQRLGRLIKTKVSTRLARSKAETQTQYSAASARGFGVAIVDDAEVGRATQGRRSGDDEGRTYGPSSDARPTSPFATSGPGSYLTDGRRLFRVIGEFRAGEVFASLEDCITLKVEAYAPGELAQMRPVPPPADRPGREPT